MKIRTYNVQSLGGYMDCVGSIAQACKDEERNEEPPVLWFRGHDQAAYFLLPALYRNINEEKLYITEGSEAGYTKLHYAGDVRTQHYMAKNTHLLQEKPSSKLEWLEVMQHHEVKTRLLDWSESAVHSLLFALECFFDGKRYSNEKRRAVTPCVWVLNPKKLNKTIFELIFDEMSREKSSGLYQQLEGEFSLKESDCIKGIFCGPGEFSEHMETMATKHIDYIVNLSKITEEMLREEENVRRFLSTGRGINPYYYVISRIYADGLVLKNRLLPPLAIVNAYHSERVKAQKGVFTVFPHYMAHEGDKELRDFQIIPEAMEHNDAARKCLYKINLSSPQKIAYELMACGVNTSWLYPEMPIIANEIENRRVL